MADNTTINSGSGGDTIVTREISHGGDTAKLPGSFVMGITGSEGSYTAAAINGDATNGLDVDVTRVSGTVTVDGSGVTQPVSAASLPLPSGAATAANQATGNGTLANIEGSLDLITPVTSNIVQCLGIDGSTAPSFTFSVGGKDGSGNLQCITTDTSGHAQVDVLTVPETAVTNAGLTELAAAINSSRVDVNLAASGATVTVAAANDGSLNATLGDGTNTATIRNLAANDALNVAIVDASGDQVTSFGGSNASVYVDDADWTALTSSHTLAGGIYQSTPGTITDGDTGPFRVTQNGYMIVRVEEVASGVSGTQYTLGSDTYTEATSIGTVMGAVRNDTLAALANTDNEFAPLQVDPDGALYVTIASGSSSGTEATHDSAVAADGPQIMFEAANFDGVALPNAVNAEGDAIRPKASLNGIPYVMLVSEDGSALGTVNVNPISGQTGITGGAGAVGASTPRVTLASDDPAVALLGTIDSDTSTIAGAVSGGQFQVDIVADGAGLLTSANFAAAFGTAGSADAQVMSVQGIASMTPLLVDATGQGDVPVTLDGEEVTVNLGATDNAVLDFIASAVLADDADWNDGVNTHMMVGGLYQTSPQTITDGDVGPIQVDNNGNQKVVGKVADDAAASGNPILIAGVAIETDGTDPGAVSAEGDAAFLRTDLNRRLLVNPAHPRGLHARDNGATAETDTEVIGAPGAGLHIYITDLDFYTDTDDTLTVHEDEGGGSEAVIYGPAYPAARGGFTKTFTTPIRVSENLSVGYTTTATGNHTLEIGYYIGP